VRERCPKCDSGVVWQFSFPKTTVDYRCLRCGSQWNKTLEETQSRYGRYLGEWGGEIVEFERILAAIGPWFFRAEVGSWFFFKGKSIYTAWREHDANRLIITKSLQELSYWVALATQNTNGWFETYRRLVDRS